MKQVIIMRSDLEMSVGKQIAQGAHASIGAYLEGVRRWGAESDRLEPWARRGQKKVTLVVDSEEELRALALAAHQSVSTTTRSSTSRGRHSRPTTTRPGCASRSVGLSVSTPAYSRR